MSDARFSIDPEVLLKESRWLYGLARSLVHDEQEAEDVVQTTFLTAVSRPPRTGAALRAWLGRVARRLAIRAGEQKQWRARRELGAARPEAQLPTVDLVGRASLHRVLVEGVLDLEEPYRTTVLLRYFEDVAVRVIAARQNVPVATVHTRLRRALAQLRARLNRTVGSESWRSAFVLSAGAVIMTTNAKVALAAAVVLIAGAIGWQVLSAPEPPPREVGPITQRQSPLPAVAAESAVPIAAPIVPKQFEETPASEAAAPAGVEVSANRAIALEVEVIGPTGKPASNARLLLHRKDEVLGTATTDLHGLASFTHMAGEAELLIIPEGSPVHATSISTVEGRRQVLLPAGVAINGRVEIDGGAPVKPVSLLVDSRTDILQLAGPLWTALKSDASPRCTTTDSGEFEFAGLREGSEWRFFHTLGYRVDEILRDGKEVFAVTAPATGILVRLSRVAVIRGRVVSQAARLPIPRAPLQVSWEGPISSVTRGMQADDGGVFQFSAEPHGSPSGAREVVKTIGLKVGGKSGLGERTVVLEPPPLVDRDLGDLDVASGRLIRFVARDPGGVPIEGAIAGIAEEAFQPSRTDAQGRGTFTAPPGAASFRIGAMRYEVIEVGIPPALSDVLPVTLAPNAGIEVTVITNSPALPGTLPVHLSSDVRDIFGGALHGNDPIYVAAGASNGPGNFDSRGANLTFVPKAGGRVMVAGLKPAIPLSVAVVDGLGQVHASTAVTLGHAEWRVVELRVTKSERTLHGRVHDSAGNPIEGARATVNSDPEQVGARNWLSGDAHSIDAMTDAAGRFKLSGLFSTAVHFAVDRVGYVPLIRRDFTLPRDDAEIDLTLEKGCTVTVQILEADGTPIRDLRCWANVPGYPKTDAHQKEPGAYAFVDLPADVTATITTTWGNREWTWPIIVKGDQTEKRTMPPMGKVTIDFSGVDPPPFVIVLTPVGGEKSPISALNPGLPGSRELTMSPVPPGEYAAIFVADGKLGFGDARPERVTVRPGETIRVVLRKP